MSAALQGVALQQRAYHVHCARISAVNAADRTRRAAHAAVDAVINAHSASYRSLEERIAEAREWHRIVAACRREELRLAKLKHGGAQ